MDDPAKNVPARDAAGRNEGVNRAALDYHRLPRPGKISVVATKDLTNQRDLALAYTPGVAAACNEIVRDETEARSLTDRKSTRLNSSH